MNPSYKPQSSDFYCFTAFVTFQGENKTTENSAEDAVGNDTNVQTSSEMNSREKDDLEKTQNTTEEIANDKEEENIDTKTEETANNGNHCAEVVADDGNNNVENTEGGKTKDSVRRTRFSSEITIQPKAYFQAGAETVVMMVCMIASVYIVIWPHLFWGLRGADRLMLSTASLRNRSVEDTR